MNDNDESWRKSSFSGGSGGNCVEIGQAASRVLIRDTKQKGLADRDTIAVPASAWLRFTESLKS